MPSSDAGGQTTVERYLAEATQQLQTCGIPTAHLDALVLLEDVLRIDRAHLLAHPDQVIAQTELRVLHEMIRRRATHEPLAYIRNKSEFYGCEFYVDHHVLEPRPESETMIDLLKSLDLPESSTVLDVGTGSGALAITAKLELPTATVCGVDIDPACLKIAEQNTQTFHADVQFIKSDLLASLNSGSLNGATLLCNLPYVPDNFQINPAAMREPRLAIFGGPDGLDLYRKLFQQIRDRALKPAYVLTEALPPQHFELKTIAADAGFLLDQSNDFIQVFRTSSGRSAAE